MQGFIRSKKISWQLVASRGNKVADYQPSRGEVQGENKYKQSEISIS
jgi:hypothetical protein